MKVITSGIYHRLTVGVPSEVHMLSSPLFWDLHLTSKPVSGPAAQEKIV